MFILAALLFGVFGFSNVIGVCERSTIVSGGPCMGSLLSLIYKSFQSSSYLLTQAWSHTKGRASCLSMRRAMWHDLFQAELLIMLMAVSFRCHKHQYLKKAPSHGWKIGSRR